jgi:hypothetical protein
MEDFEVGETVRINVPGESEHERTGVVTGTSHYAFGDRVWVDLGDVTWQYSPGELVRESK